MKSLRKVRSHPRGSRAGVLRALVALFALVVIVPGCGIDSADRSDGKSKGGGSGGSNDGGTNDQGLFEGVPDISGTWSGAFVDSETGEDYIIRELVVLRLSTTSPSYQFSFQMDFSPDDDGFELISFTIFFLLADSKQQATLNEAGEYVVTSSNDDMIINGVVDSKTQMSGDWLIEAPVPGNGTWSVTKISDEAPEDS